MVRSIRKINIGVLAGLTALTPIMIFNSVSAANPESLTFQVNIDEVLTMSVTDPATWASGGLTNCNAAGTVCTSDFLRNKVNVSATTNNGNGVTVSMYANDLTLHNQTVYDSTKADTYIPTLPADYTVNDSTASTFPVNNWGYSVMDEDTLLVGAVYKALQTSANPIQLFSTVDETTHTRTNITGQKNVFFGAKADSSKQSGTYAQTVYFVGVTGVIDTENPAVPTNPSEPNPISQIAQYDSSKGISGGDGQTRYTTRTTTGSGTSPITGAKDTTATNVTSGDTRGTYTQAAGVTSSSGDNSSALATALAVSAAVTAASGAAFLLAAKRDKDDEEEG